MNRFDVVVVGGGPAGVAAALTLRRGGCSVLVVERSPYSAWRVGETFAPEIESPLRALGVWDRFTAEGPLVSGGIRSAWGTSEIVDRDYFFHPYGNGWHVDRLAFDRMLADAAEDAGVDFRRSARVTGVTRRSTGVVVHVDDGKAVRDDEAAMVVDATGREAAVAVQLGGSRLSYDRLVAVVGIMDGDPAEVPEPVLVLEAVEQGWWYSAPLPGGRFLATYVTDGDILQARRGDLASCWRERLAESVHTSELIGSHLVGRPRVRWAGTGRLRRPVGDGWMAVGDAAAALDPLGGRGVFRALTDGIDAATALLAHLSGDATALDSHAGRVVTTFGRDLQARAAVYGAERRWPHSLFWRRRHRPVTDALAITLDPSMPVRAPVPSSPDVEALLALEDARLLEDLCRPPARVHEVASAFRSTAAAPPDDRSLVVALQLLLDAPNPITD